MYNAQLCLTYLDRSIIVYLVGRTIPFKYRIAFVLQLGFSVSNLTIRWLPVAKAQSTAVCPLSSLIVISATPVSKIALTRASLLASTAACNAVTPPFLGHLRFTSKAPLATNCAAMAGVPLLKNSRIDCIACHLRNLSVRTLGKTRFRGEASSNSKRTRCPT